jgi:hypothetical protein
MSDRTRRSTWTYGWSAYAGWVTRGEEYQVVAAMQVHTRMIHGTE